jgi:hypothetical protein
MTLSHADRNKPQGIAILHLIVRLACSSESCDTTRDYPSLKATATKERVFSVRLSVLNELASCIALRLFRGRGRGFDPRRKDSRSVGRHLRKTETDNFIFEVVKHGSLGSQQSAILGNFQKNLGAYRNWRLSRQNGAPALAQFRCQTIKLQSRNRVRCFGSCHERVSWASFWSESLGLQWHLSCWSRKGYFSDRAK